MRRKNKPHLIGIFKKKKELTAVNCSKGKYIYLAQNYALKNT